MLEKLYIKNFKSVEQAQLNINQLTIFTGENSSGKSTVLQAYLLAHWQFLSNEIKEYIQKYCPTPLNINAKPNDKAVCQINDRPAMEIRAMGKDIFSFNVHAFLLEKNLGNFHFLCADRIGPQEVYNLPTENSFGVRGQFAPSFFDLKKYEEVDVKLCADTKNTTLGSQVNYWLKEIIGTEIKTEKIANLVLLKFKNPDGFEFLSINTGFGSSVVFSIIIACLSSKIGDTIVIENPEIHLHPKAQAKLADFFAFIANAGIRVILETHCEHLIYKLCYNVYKKEISNENVTIYYKEKDNSLENSGYKKILLSSEGRFINEENELIGFPEGFFDATTEDYLKIF